jgi:hypothetical protein
MRIDGLALVAVISVFAMPNSLLVRLARPRLFEDCRCYHVEEQAALRCAQGGEDAQPLAAVNRT